MVTAIVLLTVDKRSIEDIAESLSNMQGITEVYSVTGRFDLAAIVRVAGNEQLADIVTHHMSKLEGIQKSETMLALRWFSRHNLERMFSIGMEGN